LVNDSGRGARFELRDVPNAEPGMSPMEIWSNEAQERYVLGVDARQQDRLDSVLELSGLGCVDARKMRRQKLGIGQRYIAGGGIDAGRECNLDRAHDRCFLGRPRDRQCRARRQLFMIGPRDRLRLIDDDAGVGRRDCMRPVTRRSHTLRVTVAAYAKCRGHQKPYRKHAPAYDIHLSVPQRGRD